MYNLVIDQATYLSIEANWGNRIGLQVAVPKEELIGEL